MAVLELPRSLLEMSRVYAPAWGLDLAVRGRRGSRDVFRLPLGSDWIRNWVMRPNRSEDTEVPESAINNSTTETTTLFRPCMRTGRASSILRFSTHWLLTPWATINGYTVGLIFMDILVDNLDEMCVRGAPSGRFAMNESTGEIIATAFRDDGTLLVGWIESVTCCERVRELLMFEAPEPGHFPRKIMIRNSFYERRNCKLCGVTDENSVLPPPCSGVPRRRITNPTNFKGFGLPGFRGNYFGTCEKTLFRPANSEYRQEVVPVFLDIRHSIPSVNAKLKLRLRKGIVSFGTAPRISSGLFYGDILQDLLKEREGELCVSLLKKRRRRQALKDKEEDEKARNMIEGTQRRRNADRLDRETIHFQRRQRNRESARRANEARKKRIQDNQQELQTLKTVRVPQLQSRMAALVAENNALRKLVDNRGSPLRMNSPSKIIGDSLFADA